MDNLSYPSIMPESVAVLCLSRGPPEGKGRSVTVTNRKSPPAECYRVLSETMPTVAPFTTDPATRGDGSDFRLLLDRIHLFVNDVVSLLAECKVL